MRLNFKFIQTDGVPLTANLMDVMQQAYAIFDVIGDLAGNFTILSGCEVTGTLAAPGIVAINGDVLFFEGGTVSDNVYIYQENIAKVFRNQQSKILIEKKTVKFGDASQVYPWSDFVALTTLRDTDEKFINIQSEIDDFQYFFDDLLNSLNVHIANRSNPHQVTAEQIGILRKGTIYIGDVQGKNVGWTFSGSDYTVELIGKGANSPADGGDGGGTTNVITEDSDSVIFTGNGTAESPLTAESELSLQSVTEKGNSTNKNITVQGVNIGSVSSQLSNNIYYGTKYTATGSANSIFGFFSLKNVTSGNYNTAIGSLSLQKNTTGNSNTALGLNALGNLVTGNNNIHVGITLTIGADVSNNFSRNIHIGNNISNEDDLDDILAIENKGDTVTDVKDSLIYGNFNTRTLKFNANLSVNPSNIPSANSAYTKNIVAKPDGTFGWEDKASGGGSTPVTTIITEPFNLDDALESGNYIFSSDLGLLYEQITYGSGYDVKKLNNNEEDDLDYIKLQVEISTRTGSDGREIKNITQKIYNASTNSMYYRRFKCYQSPDDEEIYYYGRESDFRFLGIDSRSEKDTSIKKLVLDESLFIDTGNVLISIDRDEDGNITLLNYNGSSVVISNDGSLVLSGGEIQISLKESKLKILGISGYVSEADAILGGLATNDLYKTTDGTLKIVN